MKQQGFCPRFMCFNMVLPSTVSVDNIFGSIMKSKFSSKVIPAANSPILAMHRCHLTMEIYGIIGQNYGIIGQSGPNAKSK